MNVFRKMTAALLAIFSLAAANDAMAACSTSTQVAWWDHTYHTLRCQNTNLADFQLNPESSKSYKHAQLNLTGGTWAQIHGLTQSGAYVSGCSADDLSANNSPVYLNWNGTQNPNCEQAFLALLGAGTFN
jgi:hypothetical protein